MMIVSMIVLIHYLPFMSGTNLSDLLDTIGAALLVTGILGMRGFFDSIIYKKKL